MAFLLLNSNNSKLSRLSSKFYAAFTFLLRSTFYWHLKFPTIKSTLALNLLTPLAVIVQPTSRAHASKCVYICSNFHTRTLFRSRVPVCHSEMLWNSFFLPGYQIPSGIKSVKRTHFAFTFQLNNVLRAHDFQLVSFMLFCDFLVF